MRGTGQVGRVAAEQQRRAMRTRHRKRAARGLRQRRAEHGDRVEVQCLHHREARARGARLGVERGHLQQLAEQAAGGVDLLRRNLDAAAPSVAGGRRGAGQLDDLGQQQRLLRIGRPCGPLGGEQCRCRAAQAPPGDGRTHAPCCGSAVGTGQRAAYPAAMPNSPPATARPPSVAELFGAFFLVGILGFGGVLPLARRTIVERRRWLSPAEFTDLLSLCQFLPGANITNLSIALGGRGTGRWVRSRRWPGCSRRRSRS